MTPYPFPPRPAALLTALLGSAAWNGAAQATDAPGLTTRTLAAYRSMAGALDAAVSDRARGAAFSLADLERAQGAYATLKPAIRSGPLSGGIERTFQAARGSLARSPADLEAQVVQLRSLMRKVLHDQTLALIGQPGGAGNTRAQAALLGGEFGLQGPSRSRFLAAASAGQADLAARLLRRAAAGRIQDSLAALPAGGRIPANSAARAQGYLALARASGWFTVVQDAPQTGGLSLATFGTALGQLTGNDPGLPATVTLLRSQSARFVQQSDQALRSPASLPRQGAPAATTPGTPAAPSARPSTPATPAAPAGSAPQRGGDALTATYAALARALAAAGHDDTPQARLELGRAATGLSAAGGGSRLGRAPGYQPLADDLAALRERSGLRPGEVQAVIGELGNLEREAAAQPVSGQDAASGAVSRLLGGPVLSLLFLLAGLLGLYPLYLLNLAFGGRNAYWRAIWAALALLLLPALLEGLGGVLLWLGDVLDVSGLRQLGSLSLRQGLWGQPIWLLSVLLAVALATSGFRGLCQQFGLLARDRSSPPRPQPALDWDEEP